MTIYSNKDYVYLVSQNILKMFLLHLVCICVCYMCGCRRTCHRALVEVKGELVEVGSLHVVGPDSGCQA